MATSQVSTLNSQLSPNISIQQDQMDKISKYQKKSLNIYFHFMFLQYQKYLPQPPNINSFFHCTKYTKLGVRSNNSSIYTQLNLRKEKKVNKKMEGLSRPNRSDVHLSAEEEANIEAKTRHHFDEVAPKRHTKPQRSEYASQYVDNNPSDNSVPEMIQFQRLENDPSEKKLVYDGNEVAEEFVETEYYKDLNSVDKHHHTTGKGFIQVEKSETSFHIEPDNDTHDSHHSSKGNPATNEWVPAPFTEEGFNSDKPNRSDN